MAGEPCPPPPRPSTLPPRPTSTATAGRDQPPGRSAPTAIHPAPAAPKQLAPAAPKQLAPAAPKQLAPAAPKRRPDPRPTRLALGAGTIAAVSIMAAGLVRSPAPSGDAIAAEAMTVETIATAQPEIIVKHRIRYVQLKPGLGLALVHAAMLTLDRSVPFTIAEVFVPFTGPYRPLWVGLGQLSLIITVVVVASFSLRKRLGQKRWRTLHYVTFLALVGATAHGLMAGTDTGAPWAIWGYLLLTAAVVFLAIYRVVLALALRRTPAVTRPGPRVGREVVSVPVPPAGERGDAAA